MKRLISLVLVLIGVGLFAISAAEENLRTAAARGDINAVQELLDKGADVNAKDEYGYGITALMEAAHAGRTETARLLIEKGADMSAKDQYGTTPLMWAASYGRIETAKLLIEKGADVNAKNNHGGTALMGAARGGHTEIGKLLVEKGADVNAKDKDGLTALMEAASSARTGTAKFLIEKGADIDYAIANLERKSFSPSASKLLKSLKTGTRVELDPAKDLSKEDISFCVAMVRTGGFWNDCVATRRYFNAIGDFDEGKIKALPSMADEVSLAYCRNITEKRRLIDLRLNGPVNK